MSFFIAKTLEGLQEQGDNSFDLVLSHNPDFLEEMFRVARKDLIIETDSLIFDEFNHRARTLSDNVSYLRDGFDGENTIVIGKKMDNIVFTLDDFHEENHNLDLLLKVKEQSPNMKVTLFTIPSLCSVEWIRGLKEKYPWMEFAMHGWRHFTERGSQEADLWTKEEALKYLTMCEEKFGDLFVKGFKAPGWQMNPYVYDALKEKGYWIMDGAWLNYLRPANFTDYYETQHLWEVNGHIQDTPYNGLENIINNKNPFLPDSNFYFVSEMIGTEKDKLRMKKLCR